MNIVFFGDSVTEGCFDIIRINGQIEILRDVPSGYASLVSRELESLYPSVEFNFYNSGISGNETKHGLERIKSDVMDKNPDLIIMCFGLNDVYYKDENIFNKRLNKLFDIIQEKNIPIIFMTPNMMNRYVSLDEQKELLETARSCMECQNSGVLDRYMDKARESAKKRGIYLVDAYKEWKRLESYGIDTTELLCNRINHPKRQMHNLFKDMIIDCIRKNELVMK